MDKENVLPVVDSMDKENSLPVVDSKISTKGKVESPHSPDSMRIARALGIEIGNQKQCALLKHLVQLKGDPKALGSEIEKIKKTLYKTQTKE